jgi:hypothetical protein
MAVGLMLIAVMGCKPDERINEKIAAQNATHIQKLANGYKLYAYVNGHVGPKSADELKQFLTTNKAIEENLKLINFDLDQIDSYFISQADGEEFRFRWGVEINPELDYDPIIFDRTGVDGMRRVMLACDLFLEVTDDKTYERFLAGNIERKDVPASVFGTDPEANEEDEHTSS